MPEYSSSVAPVLLIISVPMVIIPCTSMMAIKGIRKIRNMVGFLFSVPFMSSLLACRTIQRVIK